MTRLVPETPPRGAFWRVLQLVAGVALFLYALRVLSPMPGDRAGFVLLVALLAAGSMALADSVVGLVATAFERVWKRRRE